MSLNRRSLFAALLGATAVNGAECISGEAHGDFNSHKWEQCVDGKWVKRVDSDDIPRTRIGHADIHTPYTITNPPPVILLYNNTGVESLGCPFNHDWEEKDLYVSEAPERITGENGVAVVFSAMSKISCCKRCGVLGMPK